MSDFLDGEIRGDHSNFKGSFYHLVYALWRLVRYPKQRVAFYQGNDLLASLIPPPNPEELPEATAVYSKIEDADRDIWCQLKNTQDAWTVSEILKDNLLLNFIGNSFASDSLSRGWEIELVTTGEIRAKDLRDFANGFQQLNGSNVGSNSNRLNAIIDQCVIAITESKLGIQPSRSDVAQRAVEIIQTLSTKEPLSIRALQAEFQVGLLTATGDTGISQEIKCKLLGAVLENVSAGPQSARWYDVEWFREVTGFDLTTDKPFDRSVRQACNAQVQSRMPAAFSEALFAERADVQAMLAEFHSSSKTCFIVTGRSGTGKSWSMFHWANHALNDRARIFLDGQRFQLATDLSSILAAELRTLTSRVTASDRELADKLVHASQAQEFGPLVLVIDDIQPTADRIETFRADLNRLVLECESQRIKLVISCQTERVSGLHPFLQLRADLLFHPGETGQSRDRDTRCKMFAVSEFLDSELEEAIARRLSPELPDRHSLRFKAPIFRQIRNPYLLDQLWQSGGRAFDYHSAADAEKCVDNCFQQRVENLIQRLVFDCGLDETSAEAALNALLESLWQQRHRGAARPEVERHLEQAVPGFGARVTEVFVRRGVVAVGQSLAFAEPQLAARSLAQWLRKRMPVDSAIHELFLDTDAEVLAEWLRLQESPAEVATSLVSQSVKWKPAAAHALSRCRVNDGSVTAALIGLARSDADYSPDWDVCDALGDYAMRSRVAWKWLVRLFVGHDDGDRTIAERALWHMARFVPERVAHAVRLRIARLGLQRLMGDKDRKHRQSVARAMRPLRNIDSRFAGRVVLKTLAPLASYAQPMCLKEFADKAFDEFLTDPLVEEFDELQTVAAFHADRSLFSRICDGLRSEDRIQRLRSANGIATLGREASSEVGPLLADAVRREQVHPIAERMIWHLVGFAEVDPQAVRTAVANCPAHRWDDYEVSGTVLSLFEWIGRKYPEIAAPSFPHVLMPQDDEARFWLLDTFLVALQPYLANHPDIAELRASLVASIANDDHKEPEFAMLRHRALAIARLLEVAHTARIPDTPDIHRAELERGWRCFFLPDADAWIREHMSELLVHSNLSDVVDELFKSITASAKFHPDHFDKWRKNAAFMLTRDSIDVLVVCLMRLPEHVELLKQMPHDWETLYAVRHLLALGNRSTEIIELAQSECASHRNQATPQANSERTECLIELRKIDPSLVPEIGSEQSGLSWFFGGGQSASDQLAAAIDGRPSAMLEIIEETLRNPSDAIMTLEWVHKAKRWESVVLSYLFVRCADPKPLSRREADELIAGVLGVLVTLPDSESSQSWRAIYGDIQRHHTSGARDVTLQNGGACQIHRSHVLAAEILQSRPPDELVESSFVTDRRGWWETEQHKREPDGAIQHGGGVGYHLCGFFPAVRLALAVCSSESQWADPAAKWMRDRTRSVLFVKELDRSQCSITEKIRQLQDAIREMPHQERLHLAIGNSLVKDRQYEAGFAALSNVLTMPHADRETRANALYDCACIHARRGNEDACRQALSDSAMIRKLDKRWLAEDSDFDNYRNADWFAEFLI